MIKFWNLAANIQQNFFISKEKKKIFEAQVTDVKTLPFKEIKNNDKLAQEEGYEDSNEMVREFKKMYPDGISDEDLFQVIYFEKLDINKWKGEKIDQKEMITQRADILFDTGKYDKSVLCYNAALKIDPNDVYLLNKKGDNLSRLDRFDESIECYDKAIELEPRNNSFLLNKGVVLMELDRFDEAEILFTKVLALDPSNDDARVLKMECLENM